jgi:hypothetical protein
MSDFALNKVRSTSKTMKRSYMDYAMSVIIGRALLTFATVEAGIAALYGMRAMGWPNRAIASAQRSWAR